MSYENKNPNPDSEAELVMPFMTDEDFVRMTGGLAKGDIHPLLVNMRKVGQVEFPVTDEHGTDTPVSLTPGNMENDAFLPELSVKTEEARTTFKSWPGVKCTVTVEPFNSGVTVDSTLSTKEGIEIQSEADFRLVPATHWQALNFAKAGIERDNPAAESAVRAKKHGRIISWFGRRK